jgi:hypothetical protein
MSLCSSHAALTRVDVATGKATQVCDWSSNYYTPFVGPMWLNKDASQVFAMSLSGTVSGTEGVLDKKPTQNVISQVVRQTG